MGNTDAVTSPESIFVQLRAESLDSVTVVRESGHDNNGDQLVSVTFGGEGNGGVVKLLGSRTDVHALVIEADRQLARLERSPRGRHS